MPSKRQFNLEEDNPVDAFFRPLTGGDTPYSRGARGYANELMGQPLTDLDAFKDREEAMYSDVVGAGRGEIERKGEEARRGIAGAYARRGLGGMGAATAQMSQSQALSAQHLSELTAGARFGARQHYEGVAERRRAEDVGRRHFAMNQAMQNQPYESQVLPTMIGVGSQLAGAYLGGGGGAALANKFGGGGGDPRMTGRQGESYGPGLGGGIRGTGSQGNYEFGTSQDPLAYNDPNIGRPISEEGPIPLAQPGQFGQGRQPLSSGEPYAGPMYPGGAHAEYQPYDPLAGYGPAGANVPGAWDPSGYAQQTPAQTDWYNFGGSNAYGGERSQGLGGGGGGSYGESGSPYESLLPFDEWYNRAYGRYRQGSRKRGQYRGY